MAISFNRNSSILTRTLLAAGLVASLTACDKPDTKAPSADQASFLIDKASGDGEPVQADPHSSWKTAQSVLFSYTTCVTDRASGEKLRGQKFEIEIPETGARITPDEASDINGCVKWSEDTPFNFYAKKSTRIPITRLIVGTGLHTGKREVKFAINPWAVGPEARDRGDAVVFLRDQIIPKSQIAPENQVRAALSGDMEGRAGLWINGVDITSVRRQSFTDGSVVDLTFTVKPKVLVTDMTGKESYKEIPSGAFDIVAHLIATDTGKSQKERMILTTGEVTGSGLVRDGELMVNARTSLERRVISGNLQLAIKLLPKNIGSLTGLKPYEGIFELGDYNALSHGPKGIPAEVCRRAEASSECTVAQALANTTNFEDLKKQGFAADNDSLIFSNLRLRFATVQPGETATQRTVLYTASTCITDRWSGKGMDDMPFQIDYMDDQGKVIPGMSQVKAANEEGCLSWDSKVFHKYYMPERLIWHKVRIGPVGGLASRTLEFATNPWDDKFTFGWDAREFSPEFIKTVSSRKKIPSRFFLSNYGYHTVRFLYNVDRFMELEVKKTVLVELDPVVLRYSGIVNARKQTEPLRDGIYLLKVGIQKDYLDPADRGHRIENKREAVSPAHIPEYGGDVTRREYVTAQSQLVRVVDGKINHPVELTMRDLRLMRIRANFMIQLETVDERLVTAHHVLRDQFRNDIEKLEQQRTDLSNVPTEEREAKLKERALERKSKLETAFYMLKDRLDSVGTSMENLDLTLEPDIMNPLKEALDTNDFTDVKFASGEEFNLDNFIEKDSGLERRSFVGPVIFLSNAFSDAVRATDNLDEARCNEPDAPELAQAGLASLTPAGADPAKVRTESKPEENLFKFDEIRLFADADKVKADSRQNNAYRFSKYYGSLKHLCSKNVDDLIKREKEINKFYEQNMPIYSSIYNFVQLYNLDFVTLGTEKLQKLDMNCKADESAQCLHPTTERTLPFNEVTQLVNNDRARRASMVGRTTGSSDLSDRAQDYTQDEVGGILFGSLDNAHVQFGYCSLLAQRAAERIDTISKDERYVGFFTRMKGKLLHNKESIADEIMARCLSEMASDKKPVFFEERLRVRETGKYTFLGGLQLNLNVGESTSVSRGDSWSYGFEPIDVLGGPIAAGGAFIGGMLGGPAGAVAGAAVGTIAGEVARNLKPISLKYGTGMSNSNGTSISLSTYLVGQIARFNIQILKHERCRVARLGPEFSVAISDELGLDQKLQSLVAKGIFVCTGHVTDVPKSIEESYFYFTQHFTEGDMLDQADIYNHPWLLGLRGVREFANLVSVTNAQEVVNLGSMHKGYFEPKNRALGWPLEHLAQTYRTMLPTFPGLYTVTEDSEKVTNYPLNNRFSTMVDDINGEVNCKLNADGQCAQKANVTVPQ